jgi:hypothetical protein
LPGGPTGACRAVPPYSGNVSPLKLDASRVSLTRRLGGSVNWGGRWALRVALTRHKISECWRGRGWLQVECGSHREQKAARPAVRSIAWSDVIGESRKKRTRMCVYQIAPTATFARGLRRRGVRCAHPSNWIGRVNCHGSSRLSAGNRRDRHWRRNTSVKCTVQRDRRKNDCNEPAKQRVESADDVVKRRKLRFVCLVAQSV